MNWISGGTDSAQFAITITRAGSGAMRTTGVEGPRSFSKAVEVEHAQIWVEERASGVGIFIERDGYRAEAVATWEEYSSNGVSVRFDTPSGPIQAHAIPSAGITSEELARGGFRKVAEGLFVSNPGHDADEVGIEARAGDLTVFKFAQPEG